MFNALAHVAEQAADSIFWYCVDFMVNLARITGSSYPEANAWILLVMIPGLIVLLIGVRVVQKFQLRRLRQNGNQTRRHGAVR